MVKNIFIMTFSVTKCFQIKSQFKKIYIIKKNKNLNVRTSVLHFIMILKGFLNFVFVISPQKKALTSHFYSSQQVENGRDILIK